MDMIVNTQLLKQLRKNKAWSQDQLASISGLGLRTVQRIENEGAASLESCKALCSIFDVEVSDLIIDEEFAVSMQAKRAGRKHGYMGVVLGAFCAVSAITYSFINNGMSDLEAGVYYSSIL